MKNIDALYILPTRLNTLNPECTVKDKNNNVEKISAILSDLRHLARLDILKATYELKQYHLNLVIASLEKLFHHDIDGLNMLQMGSYNAVSQNLFWYLQELRDFKGDLGSYGEYEILDKIAVDCAIIIAGLQYWKHKNWI
jgi:hypothetical protein